MHGAPSHLLTQPPSLFGTVGITTGYKLLPYDSDSLELPPPDYNDVVNTPPGAAVQGPPGRSGSQPSAPPLSELELVAAESPPPHTLAAGGGGGRQGRSQRGTTSANYGTGTTSLLPENLVWCHEW